MGLNLNRLKYAVGGAVIIGGSILAAGKVSKGLKLGMEWMGKIKPRGKNIWNDTSGSVSIPTIGGRKPINSAFAGKTHPSGVKFDKQEFPDFTPHAKAQFDIDNLTGKRKIDNRLANEAAGFGSSTKAPKGFVWHHVENGRTMQLVPKKLHNAVRHTGGAATIKHGGIG